MDHDDYWFPDKLELQFEEMCKNQEAGLVYNSFIPWLPDAKGVFPEPHSFELASYSSHIDEEFSGWIYHLLLLDCWVLTSTVMTRAEVFNKCGTFDESLPFGEDWDFWLRISREYPFVKLKTTNPLSSAPTTRKPYRKKYRFQDRAAIQSRCKVGIV